MGIISVLNPQLARFGWIMRLREYVDWGDIDNRPRFVDTQGIILEGGDNIQAYRFLRPNGDVLVTVDNWEGDDAFTLQVEAAGGLRELNFPAPGLSQDGEQHGAMCIAELLASGSTNIYCCSVLDNVISGDTCTQWVP